MNRSLVMTALLLAFMGAGSADAAVWEDTNTWNADWEQKYSAWVETSFNEDIFTTGKYKGIPTDCADAVYASRLIFAYENNLPFVIKDPTGGSSKITNKMTRFDGTTDSFARLKKFLYYVSDVTSTKSLPNDSYPVKISRDYVKAGTIWSRPRITKDNVFRRIFGGAVQEDPGHAEIVKSVSDGGAIYLIGSTVPSAVRNLITTSSIVFMPIEQSTGLRKWMTPENYSMPKESLPGYSLEQFSMGVPQDNNNIYENNNRGGGQRNVTEWTKQVQERLALRTEGKVENFDRQAQNLCNLVHARVDVVRKSEAVRLRLGGACMNADQYDSYSTPSRDKRIAATIKEMASTADGFGFTSSQRIKKQKVYIDKCPDIEYAPGRKISLYSYVENVLNGKVSSNPNDTLEARWGLAEKTDNKCPKY